ncbi:hypothetical protein GCM10027614_71240 [Micromonospora vulcania]
MDNIDYRWTVRRDDPGHVVIRVWPIEPGRGVSLEARVAFDDPWLNYGPIITAPPDRLANFALTPVTPEQVAGLIRAAAPATDSEVVRSSPRRVGARAPDQVKDRPATPSPVEGGPTH